MAELTRRQTVAWALKRQLENSNAGGVLRGVASRQIMMQASSVKGQYAIVCTACYGDCGVVTPQEMIDALGSSGAAAYVQAQRLPTSPQLGQAIAAGLVATVAADYVGPPPPPEPIVTPPPPVGDDGTPVDPGNDVTIGETTDDAGTSDQS